MASRVTPIVLFTSQNIEKTLQLSSRQAQLTRRNVVRKHRTDNKGHITPNTKKISKSNGMNHAVHPGALQSYEGTKD